MLSYVRPTDDLWDVPVVVFIIWTLVLTVASLIVLACLRRETKKFTKRLSKADNKDGLVKDLNKLEDIMAKYVEQDLKLGALKKLANSLTHPQDLSEIELLRKEAESWFQSRIKELTDMEMNEKTVRRTILAAIRSGLTEHPLDLRGSRRSLEAAKIFLDIDQGRIKSYEFLNTKVKMNESKERPSSSDILCPTLPCQWVAGQFLNLLSCFVSHPNTIPLLFTFGSFVVWFLDCITDLAVIKELWSFSLPLQYPTNDTSNGEDLQLSYQTLTVDLYAPLLLLVLLFSLMFTLLSCSCSRLSDRYRIASDHAKPSLEMSSNKFDEDATILVSRFDFPICQAVTASLPQFCLQFTAYILIVYMLETLKGLSKDTVTVDLAQEKIDNFSFTSLWFSGLASGLALSVAQYAAFKIQHEHDITLSQRLMYYLACALNTVSMMTSSLILMVVVILPVAVYVGKYHIMIILIFGATILGLGALINMLISFFSTDIDSISTDKVITRVQTDNLLTGYLRFSQVGKGHFEVIMGAVTIVGKIFSLLTINLFLPPSQLLIHPFKRFYSTSPRSPAFHFAVAKQLIYYNVIFIMSSILLCVDINEYSFNYGLTSYTKNMLVWANFTGVPCLFLSLLILFKFYNSFDVWTSNGVHLVYDQLGESIMLQSSMNNMESSGDEATTVTIISNDTNKNPFTDNTTETVYIATDETDAPLAESTILEKNVSDEEQNETAEADRPQLNDKKKSKKKIVIMKKKSKILNKKIRNAGGCCNFVTDAALVEVTGGCWVNVSD